MFDANQNAFAANGGKYKATPTFNIALDMVEYIPALWSLQQGIDNFFRPLGFSFRLVFGPVLGIQLPVEVKVESVEIDNAKYTVAYDNQSNSLQEPHRVSSCYSG
jgi:hypothetical protein